MAKYVVRRLIQAIPVIIGITIVIYAIMLLAPGGPAQKFGSNPKITQEQRAKFLKAWGLDQPIPVQYCRWIGACDPNQDGIALLTKSGVPNFLPSGLGGGTNGMLHGDLGYSIDSGENVGDRIGKAALPTLLLAGTALITWITIAILLGVLAALKPYSLFDKVATIFSYVGFAMPTFWLGLMLILIFGASLKILPVSGMVDTRLSPPFGSDDYWLYFGKQPLTAIGDVARHLVLPVVTLVVGQHRRRLALRPGEHARGAWPGLRPDRRGRRACRASGRLPTRASERAPAGRDEHRPRDPVPLLGRDRHRVDLLVAR